MNRRETREVRLGAALRELRGWCTHRTCEDPFYSCPKSEDGPWEDDSDDDCNCGAEDMRKIIDEALKGMP